MPEAFIYYACADGGGCATKQPFRNSILMLSAKFPGGCNYGIRCRMESFVKGSRAGRGVVGTFCDASSYSNRRRRQPDSIRPEPTRLLHVKLLSRGPQKTAPPTCKYKTRGILTLRQRSAAARPEAAVAGGRVRR
jgi:hypothetical protein